MAEGHRKRLRTLVKKAGFESLSIYQQVEYILFSLFPRIDTLQIAHDLVDKFGSLHGILDASAEELQTVNGMGKNVSLQLSHLKQIYQTYCQSKITAAKDLSSPTKLANYCKNLFEGVEDSQIIALAMSKNNQIIAFKNYSAADEHNTSQEQIKNTNKTNQGLEQQTDFNERYFVMSYTDLVEFAANNHARSIIVTHNHPNGCCMPSKLDDQCTKKMQNALAEVGKIFYDHVVVGTDGVFSFRESKHFEFRE